MWEKGQDLTWGVPGSPTPLSQDLPGQHPTQKAQGQNLPKATHRFFPEKGNGNLNRKPDCPLPAWAPFKCLQVRGNSWSFSLVGTALMLIRGRASPIKVPAVQDGTTSVPCRPVPTDTGEDMSESLMPNKEKDMSESVMATDKGKDASESAPCGRKLWLGLPLLLVAAGLLAPLIYFAVRANSEACLDGLRAQTECQGLNQHLQRQLHQAQEVLHQKEAEAATCNQTVVTLRGSLKKEQARVEELQGELATLNQQLQDAWERLRRQSESSAEENGSSSYFLLFLLLPVALFRICKCLKK
ncbi:uncharacterized protein ACBT57_015995 isoform 2-T4 [Dama dama]|uniref:uncharacterized protein LOC133061752 isoform X2 n=1 Tax=Dama dama TaxID=30532 RepID=UPI002A366D20|nr:uncharacterized protein LOC133061752 isoform X2 [Dama dama]XP_061005883.1 uncharacterized protein LOC133061752 isoform X2 [Dama dama]